MSNSTSYVSSGYVYDVCASVRTAEGMFSAEELLKVNRLLDNAHYITAIRCAASPICLPHGKVYVVDYNRGHINCR